MTGHKMDSPDEYECCMEGCDNDADFAGVLIWGRAAVVFLCDDCETIYNEAYP